MTRALTGPYYPKKPMAYFWGMVTAVAFELDVRTTAVDLMARASQCVQNLSGFFYCTYCVILHYTAFLLRMMKDELL